MRNIFSWIWILLGAMSANASVLISIEDRAIPVGATTAALPVRAAGGDKISALALTLQIGDGGEILGGTEPFSISGFDSSSGIFNPAFFDFQFAPPGAGFGTVRLNITPKTSNVNAIAEGLIGYILINTTPSDEQRTVDIHPTIADSINIPFLITKAQDSALNTIPLTFSDGRLSVILPEPGAFSLVAAGGLLFLRRRLPK